MENWFGPPQFQKCSDAYADVRYAAATSEQDAPIWVFIQGRDRSVSLPNKEGKSICFATLPSSQAVADSLQHFAHFELLPTQNALAMLLGWLK